METRKSLDVAARNGYITRPSNSFFDSCTRLLICLRYGIGDVVMETALFDALRAVAPNAFIAALGAKPALELLHNDSCIDSLTAVEEWNLEHWYDEGNRQIAEQIRRWLAKEQFEIILDVSHAVSAVRRSLWAYATVPLLDTDYTAQTRALQQGAHGLEAVRVGAEQGWGIPVSPALRPRVHIAPHDQLQASRFLTDHSIPTSELVLGMSVEASSPLKLWPLEYFAQVADHALEQSGAHLLLFVGSGVAEARTVLELMHGRARVCMVHAASLRLVAALLTRCAAFLGNDTGLMHIAGAVGTPVVALFGPTCPGIYLPPTSKARALGGWRQACPYRKRTVFGPPLCVSIGRCLVGPQSCIHTTCPTDVIEALTDAAFGTGSTSPFSPWQ